MKISKKLVALFTTAAMCVSIANFTVPVGATTTVIVASYNSSAAWKNVANYITDGSGNLPSALRTAMHNGNIICRFAPGEYWVEGTSRDFDIEQSSGIGSNTTIIGTNPVTQPADKTEMVYPDTSTQAVFVTKTFLASNVSATTSQIGHIQTNMGATNVTFQDVVFSGYVILRLNSATNSAVKNVLIHNYHGTYPNGSWCNMGYKLATGSLWLYGNCNTVTISNVSVQCSSHHGMTITSGSPSYTTKNVYISNCRALHSGCGQLKGESASDIAESNAHTGYGYMDWSVGFDLCENQNVDNVQVTDCYSLDAWKVGFYTEPESTGGAVSNLILKRCLAVDSGQRAIYSTSPKITIPKETEAANFFFQGGYFEDCISINAEKAGWYLPAERTNSSPHVTLVRCGDRGSPISMYSEMYGSTIHSSGFMSILPTKYALHLFGTDTQFTGNVILCDTTANPPIRLGNMVYLNRTESDDTDNQAKVVTAMVIQ